MHCITLLTYSLFSYKINTGIWVICIKKGAIGMPFGMLQVKTIEKTIFFSKTLVEQNTGCLRKKYGVADY